MNKMKKNQITCRCDAYPFPHRQGGGDCEMPEFCGERSHYIDDCLAPDELCHHHNRSSDDYYYLRDECLTAGERNVGAML